MARLLREQPAIVERVFTAGERRYCGGKQHPTPHYAARFAAKEAVVKALGTGMAKGMEWNDVEVLRARNGAPSATLRGLVAATAADRGLLQLTVSMSHTDEMAIGHAVALFQDDR